MKEYHTRSLQTLVILENFIVCFLVIDEHLSYFICLHLCISGRGRDSKFSVSSCMSSKSAFLGCVLLNGEYFKVCCLAKVIKFGFATSDVCGIWT